MSNKTNKRGSTSPIYLYIVAAAAIFIALWVFAEYQGRFIGSSHSREEWGQIGDYFGGVLNPIFGLFGLLALLYTIHIQSRELRMSVSEMKRSADSFQIQIDHLRLESKKNEAIRFVDISFEKLLERIDGTVATSNGAFTGWNNFQVPFKTIFGIEKEKDNFEIIKNIKDETDLKLKAQIIYISRLMGALCAHLSIHEKILSEEGEDNYTKYSSFYKITILPYVMDLHFKGYVSKTTMDFVLWHTDGPDEMESIVGVMVTDQFSEQLKNVKG